MKVVPYIFQEKSIGATINAYNSGKTKLLNVMATGTGKSKTCIWLLERLGFKRVLWLSDRENLVTQSAMAFIKEKFSDREYNEVKQKGFLNWVEETGGLFINSDVNFTIGCIKASIWYPDCNVVMGSLQTIHNRLDKLPSDYFDAIICDEAHIYMSKIAIKTLTHFSPKLLYGMTASPFRSDGLPLSDIFEEVVFEYDIGQGIKEGFLCELEAVRIKTNISLDKVHTIGGDFNKGELVQEINVPERNILIAKSFLKYCGGRQAIGYACNIQHAMDLAATFREYGINAIAISSNEELTPDSKQKLEDYSNEKYQVVWNVGLIIAGYDNPDTGVIIHADPTKSLTEFIQKTGRGTRLKSKRYVEKYGQKAIILDVVDLTTKHNLVNTYKLDKEKKTEDRIFTTKEQKDAILAQIEARKATMEVKRVKDEVVQLLSLPKLKISKSYRASQDATESQLSTIKKWGYDIENTHYTHFMISEIFGKQAVHPNAVRELESWGYDVAGKFISIAEHQLAKKEYESRQLKNKRKKT